MATTDILVPTGRAGLLAVALGQILHTYTGLCPSTENGFTSRDATCPACQALAGDEDQILWQEWGVVLDELGSTDTYDSVADAITARDTHGGDLVHIIAVAQQGSPTPGRPSAAQTWAALRAGTALEHVARAAYAAAHQVPVADLDLDADAHAIAAVREAIVAELTR